MVRHFIPRGRAPAVEVLPRNIHPVELYSPRLETAQSVFKPLISLADFKFSTPLERSDPIDRPVENPVVAPRRRSASQSENVEPAPSLPEPVEIPPAEPVPIPEPLPTPEPIQHTVMVTVNGQQFPIHVEAPSPDSRVTMPVEYFIRYPGGLATEATSQEVIRGVAMESMDRAELNPAPATPAPQPVAPQESREQLLSEGCWVVQNGTGRIDCPSGHPSNRPYPVYQETEDGFLVGMHDPSVTNEGYRDRRYHFQRQTDGSYIYRDPDGRNWIVIRPDGRMEDGQNLFRDAEDRGLIYSVFDIFSWDLPWDRPAIPHYMWREVEEATDKIRLQMAEVYDASVTREALDNLSAELLRIIKSHKTWPLTVQHDFLFRRWDECREDTVGNEARTTIEEFIRQHYPQGGRVEFTEEEIRGFNERRRTESESFCPYGCLPDMVLQEPQVGDSL